VASDSSDRDDEHQRRRQREDGERRAAGAGGASAHIELRRAAGFTADIVDPFPRRAREGIDAEHRVPGHADML